MKDAISYIVTVKAVVRTVEKSGKEWAKISAAPDSAYGYTPEIEKTVVRETQIYEQKVDQLDIGKIAQIVNNLI